MFPMAAAATDDPGEPGRPPQKLSVRDWRAILLNVWHDSNDKNIALVAGGVTFYILIAVVPALAALLSVYGLLAQPHRIEQQVHILAGWLLPSAQTLITHQLHQIVSADPRSLSFGIVAGIVVAIYTMGRGMGGMIDALNIAYGRKERRSLIRFYATAIALVAGGMISLALVVALVVVVVGLGVKPAATSLLLLAGWPALTVYMIALLALLYRYGPDRADSDWEWASPGAILAALLWSVTTVATYEYVVHFGDYNRIYGSLGAVMIFLSWMWFSIYLVVLGAEVNGAAQQQAGRPRR